MNNTQESKKKKRPSTSTVSKVFSVIMLTLIIGSLLFAAWIGIDSYIQYGSLGIDATQNLI